MKGPVADPWAERAAVRIAEALEETLAGEDRASLVLAGGGTPAPVYGWLAVAGGIAWDRVEIYFGDERCVPPDHPDSNYRMARTSLLDALPTRPARVHRMEAEREDLAGAAAEYARVLPEEPSILLLGIGKDGHTASLFPGAATLTEGTRRVMEATAPTAPARRLTITPPVLASSRKLFVLARGREKAEAVARALDGPFDPGSCPACFARHGVWLLDEEASALLGEERK